jgi:hypothetical protein
MQIKGNFCSTVLDSPRTANPGKTTAGVPNTFIQALTNKQPRGMACKTFDVSDAEPSDAELQTAVIDQLRTEAQEVEDRDHRLAEELSEALAMIRKTPGIDTAIKTIAYVVDVLEGA